MTEKQKKFITTIAETLDLTFKPSMSKSEAKDWIEKNIVEFKEVQEQYQFEDECNSYGLPNQ